MSSANRRLVIMALPPMLTFPSCSSRASGIFLSRKMLKRMGERRHPFLTPTVILNHSPVLPFIWTALLASAKYSNGIKPIYVKHTCAQYCMRKKWWSYCTITLLHINRLNKTESAIFVSLMCSLFPKDLHSELILSSLQLVLCLVATVKRLPAHHHSAD